MDRGLAVGILLGSGLIFGGRCWPGLRQRWGGRIADFFYYVGPPYLALVAGLFPPQQLGLPGLEHWSLLRIPDQLSVIAIAEEVQKAAGLMLLEWFSDSRTFLGPALFVLLVWGNIIWGVTGAARPSLTWLNLIYDGLHWAFYRALLGLIIGELYLAMILATLMVLAEWGVSAYYQRTKPAQQALLIRACALILSIFVFYYSPNLWLVGGLQLLMVRILYGLTALHRRKEATAQPTRS